MMRLYEVRETLKESGEEDSFTIVFEENAVKSVTNLFYQTPQMRAEYMQY